VGRLGGTVGGRKLEKRAEHDDGARNILVKTKGAREIEAYLFIHLFTKNIYLIFFCRRC
jgi:hypothetical protein